MPPAGAGHEPWRIHFFQRHSDENASSPVPAIEFLASLPANTAAEFHAILNAVAKAPPPAFSGGGKWEAMHGDMAGIYEVRVTSRGANHRLFCLLVRTAEQLSGPSIVCLGGLTKPVRSPALPRDYALIRQYAAEFRKHGTVLK
jgi:Txe/YoeB family toxin of Txe-Axe toxin-antitoxin module